MIYFSNNLKLFIQDMEVRKKENFYIFINFYFIIRQNNFVKKIKDITPQTSLEIACCTVIILISTGVFAHTINTVGNIFR